MKKSLTYDFCTIDIYDNYLVTRINAGIHITPEHNEILLDLVQQYFKDKRFVYLTHRIYSYSVDPSIYKETSKIENLAGFGVIAEIPVSRANAQIEKLFLTKPFEIFNTLEDAILWAESIIKNERQQS